MIGRWTELKILLMKYLLLLFVSRLDPLREDQWIWTQIQKGPSQLLVLTQHLNLGLLMIAILSRTRTGQDWKFPIHDRLKLFLWKCAQSALPLHGLLAQYMDLSSSEKSLCPLCGLVLETAEHLFLRCQVAHVVWRGAVWPILIDRLPEMSLPYFVLRLLHPDWVFGVKKSDRRNFILGSAVVLDS